MKQFTGLNYLEFADKFSTDKDCYDYLFSMKEEIGYKCLKCGNNEYRKGRNRLHLGLWPTDRNIQVGCESGR